MIRTSLRTSLAPVLFAAACTSGTSSPDPSLAPPAMMAAVPLAGTPDLAAPRLFRGGSMPALPAATAAESAIAHVRALAPQWGAKQGTAELSAIGSVKVGGGEIVRLRQRFDGVPVERGELRVLVGPGGALVAASGVLVPAELPRDRGGFVATAVGSVTDGRTAVARALAAVHGVDVPVGALAMKAGASDPEDPATWVSGTFGDVHVGEARARKAWYRAGDALVAAWIVEAYSGAAGATDDRLHRVVVAARGGRVLEQRDLTVDAEFQYRVWAETDGDFRPLDGPTADFSPHPTGLPGAPRPAFAPPRLISVEGLNDNGAGGSDPWLADDATETRGNNVDAYADVNAPSGLTGADFRATTSSARAFDRVYDTALSPLSSQAQQMAAVTQLFYSINWLHDEWYDAGFTEATGNGQTVNYGRGGVEGDALRAEAQDFSGRNNANMSTPDDGMSPRMQVFVWTGAAAESVDISAFESDPAFNSAAYGPGSYNVTGNVVAGTDGGASTSDGCEALTNNVAGRIVLVDRGNCTFKTKTLRAQQAGAIGLIIANNQPTGLPSMGNDTAITDPITIPSIGISMADGATLRAALQNGAVSTTLFRQQSVDNDGSLDGGLVAHEFGHYLHHRLSVCGTRQCGAMSEGWGDFIAMHMIGRPGDDLDGTYSLSGYAFRGDPYFGLRRAPYSASTAKNAYTFQMVADGVALPTNHPINQFGPNSEVHNAGEIWAEALWDAYMSLQKQVPGSAYEETRDKMARYVVAGLLLAPPDGTFTEVRDAILAAIFAASPDDHDVVAEALARRGLGSCAVSPARDSDDFVGTLEDFDLAGRALPGAPVVTFTRDCDGDGALDAGDVATVTLPIANAGAVALTNGAQVTVSTTTPGVEVPSTPVTLGALAPYDSGTATFEIRATAEVGAGPLAGTVALTVNAEGCAPTTTIDLPLRVQADVTAAAAAADDFDAVPSVWTTSGDDAALVWRHAVDSGLDRGWHGADAGTMVDVALESPPLVAHATDPVTIAFDHIHQFEFSNDTYWDGGVVEISTDGGATWDDVSTYTSPGYNGILGGDSGNPLQDRAAYGDTNPSFPSADRVVLDFGTALAGETFHLRFRIATDGAVGAPGWRIDNVAATGLTNTPFPVQGPETGACEGSNPDGGPSADPDGGGGTGGDADGGCCSTTHTRPSDLLAALFAALALLWRSRRRRA